MSVKASFLQPLDCKCCKTLSFFDQEIDVIKSTFFILDVHFQAMTPTGCVTLRSHRVISLLVTIIL